ncbi:MAG: hypothetical protein EPO61_15485 [Nitrospirae bacterium]|nr:MAG: hypothetical protein EPO61_15485 [Nitrospirota bacterium]
MDLLSELAAYQANGVHATDRERIRLLELRQQLADRLLRVSYEIHSVTAEAACEEARAAHLADRLQVVQDKKVHTQTLVAIVGEAMIGIVAGGLSLAAEGVAAATMDITGGSLATGFGLAAFIEKETHQFQHRRNLLREAWEGPEHSKLFPASVWKYLTTASEDTPTLRESLVADWRQDSSLGTPGSETERQRIALFFGDGGLYTIDDLRTQAEMLESLRVAVNLMNQDLYLLSQELVFSTSVKATQSTP